jgi:hypothetical protein
MSLLRLVLAHVIFVGILDILVWDNVADQMANSNASSTRMMT